MILQNLFISAYKAWGLFFCNILWCFLCKVRNFSFNKYPSSCFTYIQRFKCTFLRPQRESGQFFAQTWVEILQIKFRLFETGSHYNTFLENNLANTQILEKKKAVENHDNLNVYDIKKCDLATSNIINQSFNKW